MPIFFNSQHLPAPQQEYVAWVDVMGIGPTMGHSLDIAANFVFKRQALSSYGRLLRFIGKPKRHGVLLRSTLEACGNAFLSTPAEKALHRFVIRGALAYGPIIHGSSVPEVATQDPVANTNSFAANAGYRNAIMLGLPMVQSAHKRARSTPLWHIRPRVCPIIRTGGADAAASCLVAMECRSGNYMEGHAKGLENTLRLVSPAVADY